MKEEALGGIDDEKPGPTESFKTNEMEVIPRQKARVYYSFRIFR